MAGNIRYAFFLVAMIWAVPLLVRIDVEKGRADVREYGRARRSLWMASLYTSPRCGLDAS